MLFWELALEGCVQIELPWSSLEICDKCCMVDNALYSPPNSATINVIGNQLLIHKYATLSWRHLLSLILICLQYATLIPFVPGCHTRGLRQPGSSFSNLKWICRIIPRGFSNFLRLTFPFFCSYYAVFSTCSFFNCLRTKLLYSTTTLSSFEFFQLLRYFSVMQGLSSFCCQSSFSVSILELMGQ